MWAQSRERLFDLSLDLLGTASSDGWLTSVNPAWQRTLGWTPAQLMAQPWATFLHPDDVDLTSAWLAAGPDATSGLSPVLENRLRTSGGDYRSIQWTCVVAAEITCFVGRDMTSVRAAEGVHGDDASLRRAIADNVADGLYVADTTGLITYINPAGVRLLGYASAEELLGRRPHHLFHHSHRDGSPYPIEECPLLLVRQTGETIHVLDDTFWRKDGMSVPVSFSSAPINLGDGTGSVVAFRDITALQAERERRQTVARQVEGHDDLREAIDGDRLLLYEQPIVDMVSGDAARHELLLRMRSPTGNVIAPGDFLPAAEAGGLIDDIDRWVVSRALELAAAGRSVSVNLSASSVGSIDMLRHIEHELARTGADPSRVTFEVTETAIMRDLEDGRRFAERLVKVGCAFALDDFGTGYGSLTYLRQLPFTYVKIDMQFVRGLMTSEPDRRFVRAIVQIAHSLGQLTVAEGVEDEATLGLLRGVGVDYVQGYHLGRPQAIAAP